MGLVPETEFNLMSHSRVRQACFKTITGDDVNEPTHEITRFVQIDTENVTLICAGRSDEPDEADLNVHLAHLAKKNYN